MTFAHSVCCSVQQQNLSSIKILQTSGNISVSCSAKVTGSNFKNLPGTEKQYRPTADLILYPQCVFCGVGGGETTDKDRKILNRWPYLNLVQR